MMARLSPSQPCVGNLVLPLFLISIVTVIPQVYTENVKHAKNLIYFSYTDIKQNAYMDMGNE